MDAVKINLDEDLANADWVKGRSWDLPTDPEWYITTYGDELGAWLDWIKTVPAFSRMPEALYSTLVDHVTQGDAKPEVKVIEAVADDLQRLLEGFRELEAKGVRHVRTRAGANKYKQPIGAVIIADGANEHALTNIRRNADRDAKDEFYDHYDGPRRRGGPYRVSQDENGEWFALDRDDHEIASDKTEEGLLKALDKYASSEHAAPDRGSRPIPPGFREATGDERNKDYAVVVEGTKYVIPPAWTDVFVSESKASGLIAIGYDYEDRRQSLYNLDHHMKQAAIKQKRNLLLQKKKPTLLKKLRAEHDDPVSNALLVIALTGFRPGSDSNTRAAADAYGISNLEARHVTINQNSITLDFIGKDGVSQHFLIRNPEIVDIITRAKGDKKNRDKLFPGVTGAKLNSKMKAAIGGNFVVKDLRTLKANEIALAEVAKVKRQPKSRSEFIKKRNEIGDIVAKQLGNKRTQALKSYINPIIFDGISENDPSWSTGFTEQILGTPEES